MRVEWSERSKHDLRSIRNYLESDGLPKPAVKQIIIGIQSATERLERWPYSGRMIPELNDADLREVIHRSWRIIYLITPGGAVEVQNVIHTARQFGE